jgi:hypothetical protein
LKLLAGLFALMLATALATLWFSRRAPDPTTCDTRDLAQSVSPDRQAQADLFEVRCGDSLTTHVALRAPLAPVYSRSDVFVAVGALPMRLAWPGPRELAIESPQARVLVAETRWRSIGVKIRQGP